MDIGKHFTAGIQMWKNNLVTLVVASLLAGIISIVSIGLLGGNMMAGMWYICLKAERGEKPEVGDLFRGFDNFVNPFVYGLAFAVLSVLGGMVVVGGVIITGLFIWGFPLIVERKLEFSAAFQGSLDVAKKDYASAFVIPFLASIVGVIGVIGCGVGILLTMPLMFTINASLYRDLAGPAAGGGFAAPMAPPPSAPSM